MIKQYFKQAWHLITQNKLFSAIYIAGTALGISMVMVMAILNYVKTSNIYPETNRDRMLYARTVVMTATDTVRFAYPSSGSLSYKAVKEWFMPLEIPEAVSFMTNAKGFASLPKDEHLFSITSKYVDRNYWKVFSFNFVSGEPFSDADYASELRAAVISESIAKKLFGSIDVVGKEFEYDFNLYRIRGVVKDVSYIMVDTYAQVWMPFTSKKDYDKVWNERGGMLSGITKVFILARHKSDFESIRNEVNRNIQRYNMQATDWKADLLGQPDTRKVHIHRYWSNIRPNMKSIWIKNLLIISLLLLVPAINLSGMNSTRMERRLGEMGVRKAFGASRNKLIHQVLTENLLLTGLGGLVGLLLSYLIIFISREWILDLGQQFVDPLPMETSVNLSFSMLFNIKIFFIVLLTCFVMNFLSALIPVYQSLRKNITDSLYIKYN